MIKEFRTLGPYLKQYWYRYVLGIACLLVVDSAQLLIPQYIRRAIDTVAAGNSQAAVGLIVLYLIGTAALIAAGRFLWRYFIHGASRRIEKAMRDRLFSKLMVLPMSFFQTNTVGDLMARATNDMQNIRMASGMAFVALFDGVFMSLAILIVMFAQNPLTAAWILIPLPLITLMIVFFGSAMGRLFKKVQEHYSNMSTVVQETLQGIRVVKSFVKEDHFSTRFSAANDHYREASMRVVKLHGLFFPMITFLAGVTTLLLLLAGGAAVLENRMTPGNLAAMLAYLEMMIWPIMGAGFTVNMIQRGAVSLKRINDILKQDSEVSCALPGGNCPEVPSGDIELRQLSFAYSADSKAILEDVSLRLPAGQTLGILGRIGSGKSTLLRLLTRVIEAPAGSVYIGGLDIGGCSLNSLRSKLGMVPQESFLFSDSIRNNVLFACPDLAENRFREVLRISALERDLELFANGWDTVVGERGLTLSGGQKQRVAIARALAREPEILIFDDALSAVDTATEEQILSAIIADRLGKTNILVSNRVSTLQRADLIAVLDEGRLVQFGTPAELIQQEGFFAETAAMQELSRQQPAGQV